MSVTIKRTPVNGKERIEIKSGSHSELAPLSDYKVLTAEYYCECGDSYYSMSEELPSKVPPCLSCGGIPKHIEFRMAYSPNSRS